MTLTKIDLNNAFADAAVKDSQFVFVRINAEGTEEIIAIPEKSFISKRAFYEKAYDAGLRHVMNTSVAITGVAHGNALAIHHLV